MQEKLYLPKNVCNNLIQNNSEHFKNHCLDLDCIQAKAIAKYECLNKNTFEVDKGTPPTQINSNSFKS